MNERTTVVGGPRLAHPVGCGCDGWVEGASGSRMPDVPTLLDSCSVHWVRPANRNAVREDAADATRMARAEGYAVQVQVQRSGPPRALAEAEAEAECVATTVRQWEERVEDGIVCRWAGRIWGRPEEEVRDEELRRLGLGPLGWDWRHLGRSRVNLPGLAENRLAWRAHSMFFRMCGYLGRYIGIGLYHDRSNCLLLGVCRDLRNGVSDVPVFVPYSFLKPARETERR